MKVHIDTPRCQGTALCVAVAPDVFALQPNGIAEILMADVNGDFVADAEDAVLSCPASALSIVEDDR